MCRSTCSTISITRHTGGIFGSTRMGITPPGGYVLNNGGSFIEHYHGLEDIPDEHKVFSMPKLNIREQMAAYKEVIDRSSLEGERLHPRKEVPER